MEQPEKLDIVWMAKPDPPRKHKGWQWEVLLRPVKAAPGSPARVRTHPNRPRAEAEVRRIRTRLEKVDPYDKWKYEVGHVNDTTAMYGIYITYEGRYTRQEYTDRAIDRQRRSKVLRDSYQARKLRGEIEGASLEELTRPNPSLR